MMDNQHICQCFNPSTFYTIWYAVLTLQSECAPHTKTTISLKKVKLKLKLGLYSVCMSVMLCM